MRTYENYKESGIQWIGEIPEHWKVKKIKHTTYIKARVGWKGLRSDEFLDAGFAYLLTGTDIKNGSVDWQNSYFIDKVRYDDDPFIQLQEDDLLITKDGTIGKIAIVDKLEKPTCLNSGVFVLRSIDKSWLTKYQFNILASNIFKSFIDYTSYGSTILHLYQNVFNEFQFPLPPFEEQTAIANYLDNKTTEIDQVVADKEALVSLYEEEKKALINEAVTKGVANSSPFGGGREGALKPSGIDWLGEVPEHWEVKRLKMVASQIGDGIHATPEYTDGTEYYFVNGNNLKDEKIEITDTTHTIDYNEFLKNKLQLKSGTVLLSINGTIGNLAFYNNEDFIFGKSICYIELSEDIVTNRFLYNILQSSFVFHCFETSLSGTTIKNLSLATVRNLKIPIPPLEEQTAIVQYIESETANINDKINRVKQEIDLLKEYRQALIFEAVTGKIRVFEG